MGTYVIINARNRQVRAQLDAPCEGTRIFALDLAGDTWHDFEYFRKLAKRFEDDGDFVNRNRHLRAAVSSLFSHFDGVVGDLFRTLESRDSGFGQSAQLQRPFCSIKRKVAAIEVWVRQSKQMTLPRVSDDMKLLRDILNHPSITKESASSGTTETLVYDSADLYGLDISEVDTSAAQISAWLDAACSACEYPRFCDTETLSAEFARALGSEPSSVREI